MMSAKKEPADLRHVLETRKVDSMNELVAGLLLDADATLPPPSADPSPASLSAVRYNPMRPSSRPAASYGYAYPRADDDVDLPRFRPRYLRGFVIAVLLAAFAGVAFLAALQLAS